MKIYTKTGDRGSTSLFGGTRVSKTHPRLEAYGSIDELVSHIGLLHDIATEDQDRQILERVMHYLMMAASMLATDVPPNPGKRVILPEESISMLEHEIDRMVAILPERSRFILPCGDPFVSQAHIARTVCRRTERNIIRLSEALDVEEPILIFINRLSDYLYILSRRWAQDLKAPEIYWNPDL